MKLVLDTELKVDCVTTADNRAWLGSKSWNFEKPSTASPRPLLVKQRHPKSQVLPTNAYVLSDQTWICCVQDASERERKESKRSAKGQSLWLIV